MADDFPPLSGCRTVFPWDRDAHTQRVPYVLAFMLEHLAATARRHGLRELEHFIGVAAVAAKDLVPLQNESADSEIH